MSSKGPPIPGGLRKHDCVADKNLGAIADFCATHPYWRVLSDLLKRLPLRTNVLLVSQTLAAQLEGSNTLHPPFRPLRDNLLTFARTLENEAIALILNTETGTAQQTIRLFGVRAPDLEPDRPNIDLGNFLALAEASGKPLSPFAGAFDLLAKFLLFDLIADTVMASPPRSTAKPIVWTTPVTGSTATAYQNLTNNWKEQYDNMMKIFSVSSEGFHYLFESFTTLADETITMPPNPSVRKSRLQQAAGHHQKALFGITVANIALAAHLVDHMTTPIGINIQSLPEIGSLRDAMREQAADDPRTSAFTDIFFGGNNNVGIGLPCQPLLFSIFLSPMVLLLGKSTYKKAWQGFDMYAIYQRARSVPRSSIMATVEKLVVGTTLKVGLGGADPNQATMLCLRDCYTVMAQFAPSDSWVFDGVCGTATATALKRPLHLEPASDAGQVVANVHGTIASNLKHRDDRPRTFSPSHPAPSSADGSETAALLTAVTEAAKASRTSIAGGDIVPVADNALPKTLSDALNNASEANTAAINAAEVNGSPAITAATKSSRIPAARRQTAPVADNALPQTLSDALNHASEANTAAINAAEVDGSPAVTAARGQTVPVSDSAPPESLLQVEALNNASKANTTTTDDAEVDGRPPERSVPPSSVHDLAKAGRPAKIPREVSRAAGAGPVGVTQGNMNGVPIPDGERLSARAEGGTNGGNTFESPYQHELPALFAQYPVIPLQSSPHSPPQVTISTTDSVDSVDTSRLPRQLRARPSASSRDTTYHPSSSRTTQKSRGPKTGMRTGKAPEHEVEFEGERGNAGGDEGATGDIGDIDMIGSDQSLLQRHAERLNAFLGLRVEVAYKSEEVENNWLTSDDEVDEIDEIEVRYPVNALVPTEQGEVELHFATIKAFEASLNIVDVQVPLAQNQLGKTLGLYNDYAARFENLGLLPGGCPDFLKVYASVSSWRACWEAQDGSTTQALEQRNIVIIKGSVDTEKILRNSWDWNRQTMNRLLPGSRYIQVQEDEDEDEDAGSVATRSRSATVDQFLESGTRGRPLKMLHDIELSESPEVIPYASDFSSQLHALGARSRQLRELAGHPDIEPENDSDRALYNIIKQASNYATISPRGTMTPQHVENGGFWTMVVVAKGQKLLTMFDPHEHGTSSDACSIQFGRDFDVETIPSGRACISALLDAGDAALIPPMTLTGDVAVQDCIAFSQRFVWHGGLPESFCGYVMTLFYRQSTNSRHPELLSAFQSFGSSWGAICKHPSPVDEDPSYPRLNMSDATAQLKKLLVVIGAVVFDRSLSLRPDDAHRPLLGSRQLDRQYIRQLWLQAAQLGVVLTNGKLPEDSIDALIPHLKRVDQHRAPRYHFRGLAPVLIHMGAGIIHLSTEASERLPDALVVKLPSVVRQEVIQDLREALWWSDKAVKAMLREVSSGQLHSILPEVSWQELPPAAVARGMKPLLWRGMPGSTTVATHVHASVDEDERPRLGVRKLSELSEGADNPSGSKRARYA